jgi:hypothetical protein
MATVEIHGATTFILVFFFLFFNSVSEQHFPVFPPTKTKFLAAPLGGSAAWLSAWLAEGQEGWVSPVSQSSWRRALPARPDSFDVTHQILGQTYPKNLRKARKISQTVKLKQQKSQLPVLFLGHWGSHFL